MRASGAWLGVLFVGGARPGVRSLAPLSRVKVLFVRRSFPRVAESQHSSGPGEALCGFDHLSLTCLSSQNQSI